MWVYASTQQTDMNVNITTYCNLACPYCFAVDLWEAAGDKPDDREISIDNLKTVIDFMKRSEMREFRMFGGEPTLHSRFEEVYETVSRSGLDITIWSNGIIPTEKTEYLSKQTNTTNIQINVQHPSDYTSSEYEILNHTFSKLSKLVSLGFVIYKTDFDAYFIIDLIKQYNLARDVKWSIAAPCYKNKNVSVEVQDHKKVVNRLVEHSREFREHNIHWYPDTTFMWCLFTEEQLNELYENVRFTPQNLCNPVLEVVPNLTVYRCYGTASLANPKRKITDFKNITEAYAYFSRKEAFLKTVGLFKECFRCDLRGRMCGAGCLVHILRSFPKRDWGYIY